MAYEYIINHVNGATKAGYYDNLGNWRTRRPGTNMNWQTITIHNTGNPRSNALNERDWLENPNNKRQASFHLAVDERRIVEVIPLNEIAYHAGDRTGNATSLGIEICESGNYVQSLENTADLVADLLISKNKTVKDLRQHYDWSGKNCPWKIRAGHNGWTWEVFKNAVTERMVVTMVSKYFKDVRHQWQATHIDSLREKGIISGRSADIYDPDSPVTRAELAVVVNKTIEYLKG